MLLVPTDKLFKSPLGLFFECCGIARAMLIIINEIEVHLDFHIYAILEFNILIGYPLEKLFQQKPFLGSRDLLPPFLSCPMVNHNPNHDLFEEAKFISPLISPRVPSETERYCHPHSDPSHVPLAIQMLFSMVKIQR
jgi:hypothetical protein